MRLVTANQATASKRRVYFHLVDATDGITAETGEAGGQPQISTNGGAWTNTGIGTLTSIGNGRYYADLTQTVVGTAGDVIETRYKSSNTAECPGDSVQVLAVDLDNATSLGLSRLDQNVGTRLASADISLTAGAVTVGTINSGAITAASIATGAVDADALATDAVTEIAGGIWNATLTTYNSNGTFGGMLIRAKNGGTNDVEINGNNHISAVVHSMQADTLNASALATDAANEIADALLNRAINGGASTGRLVKDALKFLRNRFAVSSGTLTVYEADDTTPAWTSVVTSDAAADPIVESNPV